MSRQSETKEQPFNIKQLPWWITAQVVNTGDQPLLVEVKLPADCTSQQFALMSEKKPYSPAIVQSEGDGVVLLDLNKLNAGGGDALGNILTTLMQEHDSYTNPPMLFVGL